MVLRQLREVERRDETTLATQLIVALTDMRVRLPVGSHRRDRRRHNESVPSVIERSAKGRQPEELEPLHHLFGFSADWILLPVHPQV